MRCLARNGAPGAKWSLQRRFRAIARVPRAPAWRAVATATSGVPRNTVRLSVVAEHLVARRWLGLSRRNAPEHRIDLPLGAIAAEPRCSTSMVGAGACAGRQGDWRAGWRAAPLRTSESGSTGRIREVPLRGFEPRFPP